MTTDSNSTFELVSRLDSAIRMIHRAAENADSETDFALDVFVMTKAMQADLAELLDRAR